MMAKGTTRFSDASNEAMAKQQPEAAAEIQTKDHVLKLTCASHKRFAEQNATL